MSLCRQTSALEPPLQVFWGCIPGPPVIAPLEEALVAFTADTKFLTWPTRGIYLVLLILELFGQLIFPGGQYCGCCHLGFWWACLGLTHLVLILSLMAFLKEMHVLYARICETVFHTVLDTFLTPMEQAILEESL